MEMWWSLGSACLVEIIIVELGFSSVAKLDQQEHDDHLYQMIFHVSRCSFYNIFSGLQIQHPPADCHLVSGGLLS